MSKRSCIVLAALAVAACSARQKAEITETTFENDKQRTEMLEATLRVMDAHPDYVDELFRLSRAHPRTQNRLFANTARAVADPEFADRVAAHLVAHPHGLERIMMATLDAAKTRPEAQQAIVGAMAGRAPVAARYLVDHPRQLATVSEAIVRQAIADPNTKEKMTEILKQVIVDRAP
ncbi:MAG TPA: hypothetical protein VGD37_24775 [Kofleriaceae bacterium]